MGLDTRAFKAADDAWKERWLEETKQAGERPGFLGLVMVKVDPATLTVDDAPSWHQDGLDELDWPGGLIGGMVSGNGDGPSFRGKAYSDYVEAVTGESLFAACEEHFHGEKVKRMAEALRAAVSTDTTDPLSYAPSREERESLARWFEVCAENDLAVAGDY